MNILTKITFISFIIFITFISFITFIKFLELGLEVADKDGLVWNPESEKPMWHGGIATWKVFARPESFCAYLGNPQLKDMPKAQISRWCGKCQDGLETFWMVLNFPVHDIMKSNQLVNKLTLSEKDCYIMLFYVAKTIYALF